MLAAPDAKRATAPADFPRGELLLHGLPFDAGLLAAVDEQLAQHPGQAARLDIESGSLRLSCMIHGGRTLLAGLAEGDELTPVPLADFVTRARQLENSRATLALCDPALVLMTAVHFHKQPSLIGSVALVNPAHVLRELAKAGEDAAFSLERDGRKTLLFLFGGKPARLFFADDEDDPREGNLEERFLLHSFGPNAREGRVLVFSSLQLPSDPDAGKTFAELESATLPPPPALLKVTLGGRAVRERPFVPPFMTIGRDPRVDLFIDNAGVSREHARIAWERGRWVVTDLGSSNGTTVDGDAVDRAEVDPLNVIEIGKYQIRLEEIEVFPEEPQTMMVTTRKARERAERRYVLVSEGERFPLGQDIILGDGAVADVKAVGWLVRPAHARITTSSPGSFSLRCFGRLKVVHDDKKVGAAELEEGSSFRVGQTEFRIEGETK